MLRTVRSLKVGTVLLGATVPLLSMAFVVPSPAFAQSETTSTSADSGAAEDPNDKSEHERSFDETRKHMQMHSEWSKKTGKMNDN